MTEPTHPDEYPSRCHHGLDPSHCASSTGNEPTLGGVCEHSHRYGCDCFKCEDAKCSASGTEPDTDDDGCICPTGDYHMDYCPQSKPTREQIEALFKTPEHNYDMPWNGALRAVLALFRAQKQVDQGFDAWKMTREQRMLFMDRCHGMFPWEIIEAAVRLGIVVPAARSSSVSRDAIAQTIHDSIQREAPSEYVGPCYDTADAVISLLNGEKK